MIGCVKHLDTISPSSSGASETLGEALLSVELTIVLVTMGGIELVDFRRNSKI
jgi:hypothetical protein